MVVMWLFGVATRFVLMLGVNIITSVGCGAVDDIIGNLCGAGDVAGVGDHSGYDGGSCNADFVVVCKDGARDTTAGGDAC